MPDLKPGKYAIFETSLGEITCELFPQHAPLTVENFVGLATGTRSLLIRRLASLLGGPFTMG